MEEILARGSAVVPEVRAALERERVRPDEPGALWFIVLLGRLGETGAADALLPWLAALDAPMAHRAAAADALAQLGEPVLFRLTRRLGEAPPEERLWIYAALAWNGDAPARRSLLAALEEDDELVHVVATALADHGHTEDIPVLMALLTRCRAGQRRSVEDAIRQLHAGERLGPGVESDWRLHYRIHPGWGTVPPTFFHAEAYDLDVGPEPVPSEPHAPRSLEAILAEDAWLEEEEERCEACGSPVVWPAGHPACAKNATSLVGWQVELLDEAGEDGFTDLFNLLDAVEHEEAVLAEMPAPGVGDGGEPTEDPMEDLAILRATCAWLVRSGVEAVEPGRAHLLAELARWSWRAGTEASAPGMDLSLEVGEFE